jgi:hypothetical protein
MTRNSGKNPKADLDSAIDDAVRAMTNVDADGSFRARVLDRLGQRRRPRAAGLRLMLAAAACAAVVLAVVLSRPGGPTQSTLTNDIVAVTERVAPPTQAPAAVEATHHRPAAAAAPERPVRRLRPDVLDDVPPDVVIAAVAPEPNPVEIVPLTELAPIGITPLEQAPIVAPDIAITPLTPMAEVRVEPLSPLSERE